MWDLILMKMDSQNIWFGNNLLGHFDNETLLLKSEKNDIFKPGKS
jgi:hypothetical protein